jgi:glycosyltransferase involved in cell wall biosynthesis
MKNPLVSVVMIVSNGEKYIKFAIESVLSQHYEPLEIIVVDGHSIDKTEVIAKCYSKVRFVRQEKSGVSDAYNLGIEEARGDFVAFLSHDDIWTPDKLHTQMSYMLDNPAIQYTISKIRYFLEPGATLPSGFRKSLLKETPVGRIMETLVARKEVFDGVGKFNTNLSTAEDVDWYARAADANIPMAIMPNVLLHKRIHGENISLDVSKNNQNLLKALRLSVRRKKSQAN